MEHPDSERGDSYGHFDTTLALPWGGGGCTWDRGGPPTITHEHQTLQISAIMDNLPNIMVNTPD